MKNLITKKLISFRHTQPIRLAMTLAILIPAIGISLATTPEASAAVSNCPFSCSFYTTRAETDTLHALSYWYQDSKLCTYAFPNDRSGTAGACVEVTLDPFSRIQFQRIIERAYATNPSSCIKFYAPWYPRYGSFFIKTIDTYNGPYCHDR